MLCAHSKAYSTYAWAPEEQTVIEDRQDLRSQTTAQLTSCKHPVILNYHEVIISTSNCRRDVPGDAPLRPKRTDTSHCWPILRRRHKGGCHWLVVLRSCHLLGRSWSEQNCTFGALLRPDQKTYCAIVKVDHGGDGHFQAKAAVSCWTSFGCFMPD
jgi:hypothetical protein